ncbi:hypothetical protein [Actinophytocola sediminis]
MSAPSEKINPFLIPGREHAPRSALRPWRDSTHKDLYVKVDNYGPAFDHFQDQFTKPDALKESSRLVLVAGESGCGKSALRNHCAFWLNQQLPEHGLTGEVIDLTREIDFTNRENQIIDNNKRIAHVCNQLVPKLAQENLIDSVARDELLNAKAPSQVYADLAVALDRKCGPDVVLILLLPAADHHGEVEQYAGMRGARVVFFAELAYARAFQFGSVGGGNDDEAPPVVMTVGTLSAEDIELFIDTRYEQRADDGVFPRLDDAVRQRLMSTERMSVAMLQEMLAGLYSHVRTVSAEYSNETTIGLLELGDYTYHKTLGLMG